MGVINFTFNRGLYIIGNHEVTVESEDCIKLGNYRKFIHMFKKPHPMNELEIMNKSDTVVLYLTDDKNNPEMPLVVEIWTKDYEVRRYSYSEMVEKNYGSITHLTKLSDNLAKELKDELYKIGGRISFIVDKAEDYKDVKVTKEPIKDEDFLMIAHSPQCEFKSSILTCSNQCDLLGYMAVDYNSKELKAIVVYFHVNDKKFKVPLLVALEATKKENGLHLEYWAFDGMEGKMKKYSILSSSKIPIINDVKAVYYSYENEINSLISKDDQKQAEMPEKMETGSTEQSNELYKSQVSFKNLSKRHYGEKKKSGAGLVGIIALVLVTFFVIGAIVTISAYQYYKDYKGY
ncbi:hypothetical protein MACJ_001675 [Theileria orientalis]|uniref:Uncharacterized protein n=1 Tax=Theileria orientalis TaxID=68886 RepID=A0A976QWB4_THEOR|nr:hypothetical protein MACJ_001675 [Theileria orientalis]